MGNETSRETEGLAAQIEQDAGRDWSDEISRAEARYARELREHSSSSSSAGGQQASAEAAFAYAYHLIRSRRAGERALGLRLLGDVLLPSEPDNREYLYYLAYGHLLDGNAPAARRAAARLLDVDPRSRQAAELNALAEHRIRAEGMQGAAVVAGGVAAVVGAAALAAYALKRQRK